MTETALPTPAAVGGRLRRRIGSALVLAAVGAGTACSQSPVPIPRTVFEHHQRALVAADHWQTLANHTALQIVGCLEGGEGPAWVIWSEAPVCDADEATRLAERTVYVEPGETATPFGRAFRELLMTELLRQGWAVTLKPDGAVRVAYRVDVVGRETPVDLASLPGTFAALGTGLFALDGRSWGQYLGAGALADAFVSANAFGGSQVVISTSIVDGDRLVMRKTDAYYIAESDLTHYAGIGPPMDLVPATRPGAGPPPVRRLAVVAE